MIAFLSAKTVKSTLAGYTPLVEYLETKYAGNKDFIVINLIN